MTYGLLLQIGINVVASLLERGSVNPEKAVRQKRLGTAFRRTDRGPRVPGGLLYDMR